jgi:cytochrome c oxidase subunit 1
MHNDTRSAADAVRRSFLGGAGGVAGWFKSTDHKRIALMFLAWTAGAFLLSMIVMLLPLIKAVGGPGLGSRLLLETLTYQRLLQVVAWLVPVLPGALGFFILPLQLGAANMALPGLSRWSLRLYVVGLVGLLFSMVLAPVGTGWTLDSHLTLLDPGAVALLMVALFCMGCSWFLAGINFVVTVHHGRREGLGFFDMPLAAWGFYLYGYLLTMCGAIFAIVVLYLAASRLTTEGLFGWQADAMTWRTYFWLALRPVAWFALIPAVGIVSDVISGLTRKESPGYRTLVGSMIALTGVAAVSYGAGLIGQGLSPAGSLVFSALSLLAAVPVALISFTWLSTLYRGSIASSPAASFSIAFILHAGLASLMGLILASPAVGAFLGATMFASAQLDYLTWGGAMSALLAGLHYWWPKMMGRRYNDEVAHIGAALYVVGLNLALLPRVMMGTRGIPQDLAGLVPGSLHTAEVSSLGWLILYSGLGVVAGNLLVTIWGDEHADENPWGAVTLEWTAPSPPPEDNFGSAGS